MDYSLLSQGLLHETSCIELILGMEFHAVEFELEVMGEEYLFIKATEFVEKSLEERILTDYQLLYSLIELGEKYNQITEGGIAISGPIHQNSKVFFAAYPDIPLVTLNWCKTWGLAWIDSKIYDATNGVPMFPVMGMFLSVVYLYQRWILWNAIQLEDMETALSAMQLFMPLPPHKAKPDWAYIKTNFAVKRAVEFQAGAFKIALTRDCLSPLLLEHKPGQYRLGYLGNNLVSLGYEQLFAYIATGGNRSKQCKVCQRPFFPQRGQEQYCPECQKRRKALNKQAQRLREKQHKENTQIVL